MNDNAELVNVFKKKIEDLRKEISILESQLVIKEKKLKKEQGVRDEVCAIIALSLLTLCNEDLMIFPVFMTFGDDLDVSVG